MSLEMRTPLYIVVMAVIAAPSGLRAADDLYLRSQDVCVEIGSTVEVTLELEDLSVPINGVQALFHYDNTILTLDAIVPTDLGLTDPADGWVEIAEEDTAGDVRYAAGILGDSVSGAGPHVVATATFTAIGQGTTTITFRTDPEHETRLTDADNNSAITPTTHDSENISGYDSATYCCADTDGTLTEIDDGLPCTTDTCNLDGSVSHDIDAGTCLIDASCYNDTDLNPANDCQECASATVQTAWTDLSAGTPCGGTPGECEEQDTCDGSGVCADNGFIADGTPCLDEGDACTDDVCDSGICAHNEASFISVDIDIDALNTATTREVTFVITECPGTVDTVVKPVVFADTGDGTASVEMADVTNIARLRDATYIQVTEGHTLSRRLELSFDGPEGCSASPLFTADDVLLSGDFRTTTVTQDNLIDIVDFSILATRWQQPVDIDTEFATECGAGTPGECGYGADANGDGIHDTTDFTAVQSNFFAVGDSPDNCGGAPTAPMPVGAPEPTSGVMLSLTLSEPESNRRSPGPLVAGHPHPRTVAGRAPGAGTETIDVLLTCSQIAEPVDGLQAMIRFDDALLSLVSVTPGDGAGSPWDGAAEFYHIEGDRLIYAAGLVFDLAQDDGVVARLRFQLVGEGQATVELLPASGHLHTRLTASGEPVVPQLGSPLYIDIGEQHDQQRVPAQRRATKFDRAWR